MKKILITILIIILVQPLYSQKKALRIDSLKIGGTNVTSFFTSLDSNKTSTSSIGDSTITAAKCTKALLNQIAAVDSIVNNPDDVTLENKTGETIGIKASGVLGTSLNQSAKDSIEWIEALATNTFKSSMFTNISEAIDSVNSRTGILKINNTISIANDTIPSSIPMVIIECNANIANTLYIDCPFIAYPTQVCNSATLKFLDNANGIVYPEMWGAIGDNITQDSSAIYNWLTCGAPKQIALSGGIYRIELDEDMTIYGKNINIDISGRDKAKFYIVGDYGLMFSDTLVYRKTTTLAVSAAINDTSLIVTDADDNVKVGDLAYVWSNKAWPYETGKPGEIQEVYRLGLGTTDTLFFKDRVKFNYVVPTETVNIKFYPGNFSFSLKNIIFEYPENSSTIALVVQRYRDALIENCEFDSCLASGIYLYSNINTQVKDCKFININEEGTGYGVMLYESKNCSIENCDFFNCRSGFDSGGYIPSYHGKISECYFNAGSSSKLEHRGAGLHGQTVGFEIYNNTFESCYAAFGDRGYNHAYYDNTFIDCKIIMDKNNGAGLYFCNNKISTHDYLQKDGYVSYVIGVTTNCIPDTTNEWVIKDNKVTGLNGYFSYFPEDIWNVNISGNDIKFYTDDAGDTRTLLLGATGLDVYKSYIGNNHIDLRGPGAWQIFNAEVNWHGDYLFQQGPDQIINIYNDSTYYEFHEDTLWIHCGEDSSKLTPQ